MGRTIKIMEKKNRKIEIDKRSTERIMRCLSIRIG